jgi:hypothetical protein
VRPPGVVKIDPVPETLPNLYADLKSVQINSLVLQGAPKPFDHDIVHPAPFAVHGDANLSIFEHRGETVAGELAPPISVEDLGCAVSVK